MRQKVNYHLHLPYALTLFVSLLASVLSSHSLHMSAASVISRVPSKTTLSVVF